MFVLMSGEAKLLGGARDLNVCLRLASLFSISSIIFKNNTPVLLMSISTNYKIV